MEKIFEIKRKEVWVSPSNLQRDLCWKLYFQSEYSLLSLAKVPKKNDKVKSGIFFGGLKQKFLTLRFSSLRFMTSQSGVLQNKKTKKNKQIGDKTETVFVN